MLRTILEARGFQVLLADNTADGLVIAATRELDAVITDYHVPRTNGIEFCRALRRQDQAFDRRLPLWIMTGDPALTTKEAIAAGAEGLFRKPFQATEICKRIERRLLRVMSGATSLDQ